MIKLSYLANFIFFILFGCNTVEKPNHNDNNILTKIDSGQTTNSIISNSLYLTIDEIHVGEGWTNKENNRDFLYRILFASIEEERSIYVELIEISEEGKLLFINRVKVEADYFNVEYYEFLPQFVKWEDFNKIRVIINKDEVLFDLGKLPLLPR